MLVVIFGLFKTEVIRKSGPWRNLEEVEFATLEWVHWFNNRRLLELDGRDIPDRLEKPPVVEPIDPFQCCKLDLFDVSPRTVPPDGLGLEEPEDRLGQSVVVGVANTAHGRLDPGVGQTLRVTDR